MSIEREAFANFANSRSLASWSAAICRHLRGLIAGISIALRMILMLMIERSARGAVVVFAVSGEILTDEVAELRRVLESEPDFQKVLDLKDVTLVDREAVAFLADCEADGTLLENCPSYIREWIVRRRDLD